MDGTTSLKWPLFAINFATLHDPELFDLDILSFADLTALEIQTVGVLKETCFTVKELTGLLGKQLLSIVTPINYGILFYICYYLANLFIIIIIS